VTNSIAATAVARLPLPSPEPCVVVAQAPALQVLMVFDVIATPLLADTATAWQDLRLATLGRIITAIGAPHAIRDDVAMDASTIQVHVVEYATQSVPNAPEWHGWTPTVDHLA
jgi:hypothetical protein